MFDERFVALDVFKGGLRCGIEGCIPFFLFEERYHDGILNAFQDGIGQRAFETASWGYEVAAIQCGKGDDKAVVGSFLSDAVFLKQLAVELIRVVALKMFHADDDRLDALFTLHVAAERVEDVHGVSEQYLVGVADVASAVCKVHHRKCFG